MAPTAEWIAISINGITLVGIGIVGLARLSGGKSPAKRINDLDADFRAHENDESPHQACVEHRAMLKGVAETLQRFEASINTLDVRVYELVKNGGKPKGIGYDS